MSEDNREQLRCTACNHLSSFHIDNGCMSSGIVSDVDGMSLKKCSCVHTQHTINSYKGAPTYLEVDNSSKVQVQQSLNDIQVQAMMLKTSLDIVSAIEINVFDKLERDDIIRMSQELRLKIHNVLDKIYGESDTGY